MPFSVSGLKEIKYLSPADNTQQPAMFYDPKASHPVPLVVALHHWGEDYKGDYHKDIAEWCMKNGWAYIHPDFRGPCRRPESTGSKLVVADIVSAVDYAKKAAKIDPSSIYLVGTSGGGYTGLVVAGRYPEIWAGVSVWVPISDLKAWYFECKKRGLGYDQHIVDSCGGVPGQSKVVDDEYRERSPLTFLANAKSLKLHINAGIKDGHEDGGSVPISHSLRAFNTVADPKDRISEEDIRFMVEKVEVPEHLKQNISDPTYGEKRPLFRRTSGNVTVTVFQGIHELVPNAALSWFEKIQKSKESKGKKQHKSDSGK